MNNKTTLYCFSPPIMVITILIEFGLLIYSLVRYKLSAVVKFVALILFSLAMFQVAEFRTCGKVFSEAGLIWSRAGYIFITLLPPLGLHLVSAIAKKKPGLLHWVADASAVALIALFGFVPAALNSAVCGGNYVIFRLHANLGLVYGFYYLGFLLAGMLLAGRYMANTKKNQYTALLWMIIGYLVFLVPTGVVNMLNPATTQSVPSIMCGFAVFYAIILTCVVLPKTAKLK